MRLRSVLFGKVSQGARKGVLCGTFLLLALGLLLGPMNALHAQSQSSGELKDMCLGEGEFTGELKEKAEGICWGFITAIGEVLIGANEVNGIIACPPMGGGSTALRGDIIRISIGHLRYRVKDPNLPAAVAVAQALAKAYPCE